jgi:small-conductance mechanosensitive channel
MPFPSRTCLTAALGSLALVLSFSTAASANSTAPISADTVRTAADTAPLTAIRGEDIPSSASEIEARLRDLEGELPVDPGITGILVAVPGLADSLPAMIQTQQKLVSRLTTRRALIDYELEWENRSEKVQEWRRTLRARITRLQESRDELGRTEDRWKTTIEAARRDSTPAEVLDLARSTLKNIRTVGREVKERLDALLASEVALADVQLKIQRQQQTLTERSNAQFRDLLSIDSPPLWRLGETLSLSKLADTLGLLWQENVRTLKDFLRTYLRRLLAHLVLTGLLVWFFRYTRDRPRGAADDPLHEDAVPAVLQRPEAAAFLVSCLALLWFYPRAPLLVYDIGLFGSVVPMMQIRTVLVPPRLRRTGLWFAILMVIQQTIAIVASGTELERIGNLALSVTGSWLLWRGLRPGGNLRASEPGRWPAAVEVASKILLAAAGLSIVANIAGNISLASVTVASLLILCYVAMVLVAATKVLEAMLAEAVQFGSRHSIYIRTYRHEILGRGRWLLTVAAVLSWGGLALFSYSLMDEFGALIKDWMALSWSIGEVRLSLGTVLLFGVVLWIGTLVARLISRTVELDVLGRLSLPRGVPVTIGSLTRYALVAIAFLVALAATGFQLGQLAILGGALGVGLGFGLQNIVANFVSGLILAFERPISVGDVVQLAAGLTGQVRQIGIRASIIHTFDGAEVIVPNSELISGEVINWTRADRLRRIEVKVGVAYGSDLKQVLQLLLKAAAEHEEVAARPAPDAIFVAFGESSLDFSLRFWGDFERSATIKSGVAVAVNDALTAAGISIPFPQRDLHLVSGEAALPQSPAHLGEGPEGP